jgi:tetratricopeptide (TPR) repeat protein
LAAVVGVQEADLEPRLAALVRRELLRREMDARSPERGQYAFVQALIREVAHNTLSKKDRKKLHLSAARYFESLGNDELAGVLASHYLAAHGNSAEGDEADALAGQARIALKAAATRASSLGSFDQAVAFLDQALGVTGDAVEQVELLLQASKDATTAGRLERAEEMARNALELARKQDDRELILRSTIALGFIVVTQFRVDEADALIQPALTEFADLDEALLAELRWTLARVHYLNSDFRAALATSEAVMEIAEKRGLIWLLTQALVGRGNALYSIGRRREAIGVGNLALELAIEHGLNDVRLRVMGNLANVLTETDVRKSFDGLAEANALARKLGMRALLLNGVGNFGYSAFLVGEWDAGLAEMDVYLADELAARDRLVMLNNSIIIRAGRGESVEEALAEMAQIGSGMSGKWHVFLADPEANAALARGDLRKARDSFLEVAEENIGQGQEYFYRTAVASLLARDAADAMELLQRLEETGAYGPVFEARLATLRAGICALEGRHKEAITLYRDALRGWRQTNHVWDEALTGVTVAELLDSADADVAEITASTREILDRLRAKPYLERLDAAVARAGLPAAAKGRVREPAPEVAVTE